MEDLRTLKPEPARRAARGGEHRRRPRGHRAVADDRADDHDQRADDQRRAARGRAAAGRRARRAGGRGADAHDGRPHWPHAARVSRGARRIRLAAMLLRRPPAAATSSREMEQSAIKEAGNILSSAYMNALSDFMGHDAAAVAAEPGDRHVDRRADDGVPAVRERQGLRVLRRERVSA